MFNFSSFVPANNVSCDCVFGYKVRCLVLLLLLLLVLISLRVPTVPSSVSWCARHVPTPCFRCVLTVVLTLHQVEKTDVCSVVPAVRSSACKMRARVACSARGTFDAQEQRYGRATSGIIRPSY